MIDFSRDYFNPETTTTRCGMCDRVVKIKDDVPGLKHKIGLLSKEEAAELLEYLKTKGIN